MKSPKLFIQFIVTFALLALNACGPVSRQGLALTQADANVISRHTAPRYLSSCESAASIVIVKQSTFLGLASGWVGDGAYVGDGRHIMATPLSDDFTPNGEYIVTSLKCESGRIAFGDSAKATVVANDAINGVAVLKLSAGEKSGKPMTVKAANISAGDFINLVGRSGRTTATITSGPMVEGDSVTATIAPATIANELSLADTYGRSNATITNDAVVATDDDGRMIGLVTSYGHNEYGEPRCRIVPIASILGQLKQ